MADIKLRIELNPNAEGEALGTITNANELGSTNTNLSNTSIGANAYGVFYDIEKADGKGSNGLTWADGYLVFNDDGYLDNVENSNGYLESEQNPTQFFWGVVPEDKYYYVKLEFTNATNLEQLTIFGDKLTGQFPTRAVLDGTIEVFSDDAEWTIEFPSESDTHTIEFTHWNRSNYNATITKMAVLGQYLYLEKSNGLKSVETLTESSSTPSDIFYGVLPSSGSAEVIDIHGELYDMVTDGVIPNSNLKVDVIANSNVVGSHYTKDTSFDIQSKVLSFDMGDGLSNWDNLIYGGYILQDSPQSAYQMLVSVFATLGYNSSQVDDMLKTEVVYGNDNVVGSVKSYLEAIIIEYPYLTSDTYRNTINKFCKLAQLQLIQDNGELLFVSARPVATPRELNNCISIVANSQFSQLQRSTIVKNNINYATLSENLVSKTRDAVAVYDTQSETNEGMSLTRIGQRQEDSEYFYREDGSLIGKTFNVVDRYRLEYNLSSWSDEFMVNIDDFSFIINHTVENRYHTYKKNFWNILTNDSGISTSKSKGSIIAVSPTILSKGRSGDVLFWEFEETYNSGFNMTFDSDDALQWSTFGHISYEIELRCPKLETKPVKITNGGSTQKEIDCLSELLQNGTTYNSTKMSEIILQNVINDYKYGISDATITVACADYYNEAGEQVKNWGAGHIIEVGDIVSIKKDNNGTPLVSYKDGTEYKWRVKSANFRKSGVPLVDLKLQEIRQ